ncbi:MAG: hypothetical protein ACRDV3_02095 [Acidothermaceae bacterium]
MTTDSGSSDLWIADEGVEADQTPEIGHAPHTGQSRTGEAPQLDQAAGARTTTATPGSAGGTSVVAAAERADFESRWAEIQTLFVDDPGDAVDRARGLATEVARTVTRGIADRLAALDQHSLGTATQASGAPNAASTVTETAPTGPTAPTAPAVPRREDETEQLRRSLRDYREIVHHLLEV